MSNVVYRVFMVAMVFLAMLLAADIYRLRNPQCGVIDLNDVPRGMDAVSPVAVFLNRMLLSKESMPEPELLPALYEKKTRKKYPPHLRYERLSQEHYILTMPLWGDYAIRYASQDLSQYGTGWSFITAVDPGI